MSPGGMTGTLKAQLAQYRHRCQCERSGTNVMLFARVSADDRAFWFLGPATYASHQGERPIAITWRLEHRLPADLFTEFAAAAVAWVAPPVVSATVEGTPIGSSRMTTSLPMLR